MQRRTAIIQGTRILDCDIREFGSMENFIKYFGEYCWRLVVGRYWLGICTKTAQTTAIPTITLSGLHSDSALDVYEHAYFMDHGSDRKAYLAAFFKNLNWEALEEVYNKARVINF